MARIPRIKVGQPITAASINEIIEAVERSLVVGTSGGLRFAHGPGGVTLSLDTSSFSIGLAKVTNSPGLSAASTATSFGVGTIQRYTSFDESTKVPGDLTGTDEDCYNYHDKVFTVDSTILYARFLGVLWALDVWSCTGLA